MRDVEMFDGSSIFEHVLRYAVQLQEVRLLWLNYVRIRRTKVVQ